MIQNAHQARLLADQSTDPKLEQVLKLIEAAASQGAYEVELDCVELNLKNNLKAKGFQVYYGGAKVAIAW